MKINNQEAPDWDDWGYFTASHVCSGCQETIHAAGEFKSEPACDDDGHSFIEALYYPHWMSHVPLLVDPQQNVPDAIKSALQRANPLFWIDSGACAAALRRAVEVFLDEQGIARTWSTTNPCPIKLEERICRFVEQVALQDKKTAEQYELFLRAAKIIGNDGAHGAMEVLASDIEVAAGFVGRVLEIRYPREDTLLAEAQRIASRYPPSRRRRGSGERSVPAVSEPNSTAGMPSSAPSTAATQESSTAVAAVERRSS